MIALVFLSDAAHAYENGWGHWYGDPTFRVLTSVSQTHKDQWELVEAAYAKSASAIHPNVVWDDDNGWGRPNWENEIARVSTANLAGLCGNAGGACTLNWYDNGGISEADIVFSATAAGVPWDYGTDTSNHFSYNKNTSRPYLCTMLHEMGHGLGLGHENDRFNIMGADWNVVATNGTTYACEVGSDAMAGLIAQNGYGSSKVDFGVSQFVYKGPGSNPAYSAHRFGAVYPKAPSLQPWQDPWIPLPSVKEPTNDKERMYSVTSDTTIWFEFTLQNASTTPRTIPVSFVLSTDNVIGSNDVVLDNEVYLMDPGEVSTVIGSVDIPWDAAIVPDWWLGVRADPAGQTAESLENNNSIYVAHLDITAP